MSMKESEVTNIGGFCVMWEDSIFLGVFFFWLSFYDCLGWLRERSLPRERTSTVFEQKHILVVPNNMRWETECVTTQCVAP